MPDMREKVKEYIQQLESEINRLEGTLKSSNGMANIDIVTASSKIETLLEVKNDLKGRLEELI